MVGEEEGEYFCLPDLSVIHSFIADIYIAPLQVGLSLLR